MALNTFLNLVLIGMGAIVLSFCLAVAIGAWLMVADGARKVFYKICLDIIELRARSSNQQADALGNDIKVQHAVYELRKNRLSLMSERWKALEDRTEQAILARARSVRVEALHEQSKAEKEMSEIGN